ncbi:MAG: 50S ribosomal protein L15 [Candidatus Bipolaricaulota bacterium]|nr:50S ribosomal protein L15 [Candidatus Bipolaricaulota bacterium]
MKLSDLRPTPGSVRKPKRVGRGNASGHGTYSTRGGKGQTARSGYRMPPAFEGGQTPLWKRTPKRGFKNPHRKSYAFVNVGQLNERFADGAEITPKILEEQGIIKKFLNGVKILGDGPLSKRLIVKAHKFSKSAKEKIIAAGGQAIALLPEEPKEQPASAPPAQPKAEPHKTEPTEPAKPKKKAAPAGEPKEKKPAKPKTPKKSEEKSGK